MCVLKLMQGEIMSDSGKIWQMYWMPISVFFIGVLSIILLLWVERISNKLHVDEVLIDAVMDVQIHTAKAHLRIEEIVSGKPEVDVKTATAEADQAIRLISVVLDGGKAENDDWIVEPLKDPGLRARANAIKSLLLEFKAVGLERLNVPERPAKAQAVYQRFHSLFKEILGETKQLEDIIEKDEAENQNKSRRLFLGIPAIWALILASATAGLWKREKQRKKAEEELLAHAEELTTHRERLAELVNARTVELDATNEHLRAEIFERKQAEDALRDTEGHIRYLSSRLLRAQESERKRISMELHDELGQALNVMKLQLRVMERGLRDDQKAIRKDIEKMLEYINEVIENVRRLSLDLSPTVLEDLGLTASLQWLITNSSRNSHLKVTRDIEGIDDLIPHNQWIVVYRVIQEALTNIGKHARAENVSVVVQRQDSKVTFSVEDDGKGFDSKEIAVKDAFERGLGLATMDERVRMIGGNLDLWSQEGRGTRITFSIPVGAGEV